MRVELLLPDVAVRVMEISIYTVGQVTLVTLPPACCFTGFTFLEGLACNTCEALDNECVLVFRGNVPIPKAFTEAEEWLHCAGAPVLESVLWADLLVKSVEDLL